MVDAGYDWERAESVRLMQFAGIKSIRNYNNLLLTNQKDGLQTEWSTNEKRRVAYTNDIVFFKYTAHIKLINCSSSPLKTKSTRLIRAQTILEYILLYPTSIYKPMIMNFKNEIWNQASPYVLNKIAFSRPATVTVTVTATLVQSATIRMVEHTQKIHTVGRSAIPILTTSNK